MSIRGDDIFSSLIRYIKFTPFVGLLLLPLIPYFYFYHFPYPFSEEHTRWAEFGSYIGGIYGALGFFAVTISIFLTKIQFKRQFDSDVFYKSVNSLSDLLNGGVSRKNNESNLDLAEDFVNYFVRSLGEQSPRRVRNILCNHPDLLDETSRYKLRTILNSKLPNNHDIDHLLTDLQSATFADCWEHLKYYFGNPDEQGDCNRILADIGMILFYKLPFEKRLVSYQRAWDDFSAERGISVERFFSMLAFTLSHAYQSVDRELFLKYLSAQFGAYDYVFIFYSSLILATKEPDLVNKIVKAGFLDNIKRQECLAIMYDCPSQESLELEFSYLSGTLSSAAIST